MTERILYLDSVETSSRLNVLAQTAALRAYIVHYRHLTTEQKQLETEGGDVSKAVPGETKDYVHEKYRSL
jgi:hypothetical protein